MEIEKPNYIPWAKPDFYGNEKSFVNKALTSTWISGGSYVKLIENKVAKLTNSKFALSTSNGTTAIHAVYLTLGISPGDEVIVPGFGFLAAANIAIQMGAKPVFAEVDLETWCMNLTSIEKCLSSKTRAIVPVHTYGNVCEMDGIMELAQKNKIPVIEDAAEAFGSKYKGNWAGSIGDIGTFSFQATKTITTGEGGMVITNGKDLNNRMSLYISHGMLRKKYYWHELAGHNFRLTNLQAALGCAQLEHFDNIVKERMRIHTIYKRCIGNEDGITLQKFLPDVKPVLWAFAAKLDPKAFPQGRDAVIGQMKEKQIETRPGFYPPTLMKQLYNSGPLPVCEDIGLNIISLPTFPSLSDEQICFICESLLNLKNSY
jgi:perosamine synthetase